MVSNRAPVKNADKKIKEKILPGAEKIYFGHLLICSQQKIKWPNFL